MWCENFSHLRKYYTVRCEKIIQEDRLDPNYIDPWMEEMMPSPMGPMPPEDPMMGQMDMMPPMMQPPPELEFIDTPTEPSKKFQEDFMAFAGPFCKASAEYVRSKIDDFERFRQLYHNEISMADWESGGKNQDKDNTNSASITDTDSETWRSDYIYPIAPYCNTQINNSYNQIFSGPEWAVVEAEEETPTSPGAIPSAYKMGQLLLSMLKNGKVKTSVFLALMDYVNYGSVVGKVFWHTKVINKWRWNPYTLEKEGYEDIVSEYPVIQRVPLNLWLPDPLATHSDVQRWRAIGNRVVRTYDEIKQGFDRGVYHLNKKEFDEQFKSGTSSLSDMYDASGMSQDTDYIYQESEEKVSLVMLWEVHGLVPTRGRGLIESFGTIATSPSMESPDGGVLIRLRDQPAYASGLRPYVLAQYTNLPGPFGRGMIEENEENLFLLSQFMNQIQDIARRQGNSAYMVRSTSPAFKWLKDNGGVKPGNVIPVMQMDEIAPVPSPDTTMSAIQASAQELMGLLERQTGMTDSYTGISSTKQTATAASLLHQQSQAPATTRTDIFATDFLEPALNHALSLIQQYTLQDQNVMIRDYDGNDVPVAVSVEEIQNGKYRVKVSLTNQDSTAIAKAQSLERFIQGVPNLQPLIMQEGKMISVSELVIRYFDALKLGGTDRVFRQAPPPPPMAMPPGMAGPPGNQWDGQVEQPPQLAMNGGPMGPEPTDENAMAQQLQLMALSNQGGNP